MNDIKRIRPIYSYQQLFVCTGHKHLYVYWFSQNAVRQLFEVDQSAVSIKSQVSDVVRMIATTIHQIYSIFYRDQDGSNVDGTGILIMLA